MSYYAGQQFRAGIGLSTMWPALDWETYSEAGYVWNAAAQKWESPRGCGPQTRGLKAVGTFNYVNHPTFEPLSLAYDLLDGRGTRHWVPILTDFGLADEPHELIAHVAAGGILSAWNVYFERCVWSWCVRKWGWPVWHVENSRCDMAKAQVSAYPAALENAGALLLPEHLRKDKAGHALVRKLTVPKNPSAPPRLKASATLPLFPPETPEFAEALACDPATPEQIAVIARMERDDRARRIGEAVLDAIDGA